MQTEDDVWETHSPQSGESSASRSMSEYSESANESSDGEVTDTVAINKALRAEIERLSRSLGDERSRLTEAQLDTARATTDLGACRAQLALAKSALERERRLRAEQEAAHAEQAQAQSQEIAAQKLELETKSASLQTLSEQFGEQELMLARSQEHELTLERERTLLEVARQRAHADQQRANEELSAARLELSRVQRAYAESEQKLLVSARSASEQRAQALRTAYADLTSQFHQLTSSSSKDVNETSVVLRASAHADSEEWFRRLLQTQEQLLNAEKQREDIESYAEELSREKQQLYAKTRELHNEIAAARHRAEIAELRAAQAEQNSQSSAQQRTAAIQRVRDMQRRILGVLLAKQRGVDKLNSDDLAELENAALAAEQSEKQLLLESLQLHGGDEKAAKRARQLDGVISARTVSFGDVASLVQQNMAAVELCRMLAMALCPDSSFEAESFVDFLDRYAKDSRSVGEQLVKAKKSAFEQEQQAEKLLKEHAFLKKENEALRAAAEAHAAETKSAQRAAEASASEVRAIEASDAQKQQQQQSLLPSSSSISSSSLTASAKTSSDQTSASQASLASALREALNKQDLTAQLSGAQLRLGSAEQTNAHLRGRIQVLESDLNSVNESRTVLTEQLADAGRRLSQLEKNHAINLEKLEIVRAECRQLKLNANSEEALKMATHIEALQKTESELSELLDVSNREKQELEYKLEEEKERNVQANKRNDELVDKVNDLEDQVTEASLDRDRVSREAESLKQQLAAKQQELSGTQGELSKQKEALNAKQQELNAKQQELSAKEQELQRIKDELQRAKDEAKSELSKSEEEVRNLKDELQRLQQQAESAKPAKEEPAKEETAKEEPTEEELDAKDMDDLRSALTSQLPRTTGAFERKLRARLNVSNASLGDLQKKLLTNKLKKLEEENHKLRASLGVDSKPNSVQSVFGSGSSGSAGSSSSVVSVFMPSSSGGQEDRQNDDAPNPKKQKM